MTSNIQQQTGFFTNEWRALGIVVGMANEARIARRLGAPVAIGGGTAAGARRAIDQRLAGASALLSFGFAGGLAPGLAAGTLIVPETVLTEAGRFAADPALVACLGGPTPHLLYGAEHPLAQAEAKHALHQQTGCHAVDLEFAAVAEVAGRRRIPFAVLRAVCDPAEQDLPPAALIALTGRGAIDMPRMAHSLLHDPGQIPALIALARDAMRARRVLTRHVRTIGARGPTSGRQRAAAK